MGYRKLLKDYMSHVDAILGCDLVDVAALTSALNKREVAELRTVSAELERDSFMRDLPADHNHNIRSMLEEGNLSYKDLRLLSGIGAARQSAHPELSDEQFEQFVHILVEEAKSTQNELTDD